MKTTIATILIATTLAGCAGHVPIIDTKGVDMDAYNLDLKECQIIAEGISPANSAANGAAAGVLFGALLGAAIGGRNFAATGAKMGLVEGAGAGVATGMTRQVQVVNKCMSGRGYRVLG